jgi:hypothetical protein
MNLKIYGSVIRHVITYASEMWVLKCGYWMWVLKCGYRNVGTEMWILKCGYWNVGNERISLIHLAVCLTTGPKPLPKRAFHTLQSRGSSFRCAYPLLCLRSSSSFLRLLPRLHVTSIPPFIFPSIAWRRKQFLRKVWPIQLDFRLLISCRIFLCTVSK